MSEDMRLFVRMHGALRWTGVPSRMYSRLAHKRSQESPDEIKIKTKIKWLNEFKCTL